MANRLVQGQGCRIQRLLQLEGDMGKKNDVIFCGLMKSASVNVIFFEGDVQVC